MPNSQREESHDFSREVDVNDAETSSILKSPTYDCNECDGELAPVVVTTTAKSKTYRYLSERQITNRVRSMDDHHVLRLNETNEFHIVPFNSDPRNVVIVCKADDGEIIVVTQMSRHFNHHTDDRFHETSHEAKHALKHGGMA